MNAKRAQIKIILRDFEGSEECLVQLLQALTGEHRLLIDWGWARTGVRDNRALPSPVELPDGYEERKFQADAERGSEYEDHSLTEAQTMEFDNL